jgi:hypothetical protein
MAMIPGFSSQIVSNGSARVKWLAIAAARAAVVLLTVLVARTSRAAPFDPSGTDWEGYADFVGLMRAELGKKGLVVTNRIEWNALTGQDSLILVFPDHALSARNAGAFVRAGGRLLLLDDFGHGDTLLESFDIQRVPLPARPVLMLRDNPDLAIAEPGPDEHPLTRGVDRVVTNHATGLLQPRLTTALRVRGQGTPGVALALVADTNGGRLIAVGDPSIAMNSLLRYPGNRTFAKNLIQYLAAGHGQGRTYLVVTTFGESGAFGGAGNVNPADAWLDAAAEARASLTRDGIPPWMAYGLAFGLTGAVLAWLLPRTMRTYGGATARFTRPIPLCVQGGMAGHAANLSSKDAYRGHAMLEWRKAFMDDLTTHFGLRREVSSAEVVKRVARLGVVDAEAIRRIERVLLRMADIDTMVASKKTHAFVRVGDQEVVDAGELVQRVLRAVHERKEGAP